MCTFLVRFNSRDRKKYFFKRQSSNGFGITFTCSVEEDLFDSLRHLPTGHKRTLNGSLVTGALSSSSFFYVTLQTYTHMVVGRQVW